MYFPEHKLAVECDEFGHNDRDVNYEVTRQKYMEAKLGCQFIRFNPDAKDKLYDYIEKLSNLEAGNAVLFIVDNIIADENLDKRRQSLLELAISGRHKNHYLWLLTQSYTAVPKNLRRQAKAVFVKEHLKNVKQACLYIRNECPRGFNLFK